MQEEKMIGRGHSRSCFGACTFLLLWISGYSVAQEPLLEKSLENILMSAASDIGRDLKMSRPAELKLILKATLCDLDEKEFLARNVTITAIYGEGEKRRRYETFSTSYGKWTICVNKIVDEDGVAGDPSVAFVNTVTLVSSRGETDSVKLVVQKSTLKFAQQSSEWNEYVVDVGDAPNEKPHTKTK